MQSFFNRHTVDPIKAVPKDTGWAWMCLIGKNCTPCKYDDFKFVIAEQDNNTYFRCPVFIIFLIRQKFICVCLKPIESDWCVLRWICSSDWTCGWEPRSMAMSAGFVTQKLYHSLLGHVSYIENNSHCATLNNLIVWVIVKA